MVAKGEVELALFNQVELPAGVRLAGAVPVPLQDYTFYEAAVLAKGAAPEAAQSFIAAHDRRRRRARPGKRRCSMPIPTGDRQRSEPATRPWRSSFGRRTQWHRRSDAVDWLRSIVHASFADSSSPAQGELRMNTLIGVLITFLVIILVLYLVNMLPLDGRAKQIVRVIVIVIGVISLLKYLAVF